MEDEVAGVLTCMRVAGMQRGIDMRYKEHRNRSNFVSNELNGLNELEKMLVD